jgi:uncharacterized protein YgiM (DUF1202 family)
VIILITLSFFAISWITRIVSNLKFPSLRNLIPKSSINKSQTMAIVNAPSGLKLRRGPGTEYSLIILVSNGSRVTVLFTKENKGEEWAYVRLRDGHEGYLAKRFLGAFR